MEKWFFIENFRNFPITILLTSFNTLVISLLLFLLVYFYWYDDNIVIIYIKRKKKGNTCVSEKWYKDLSIYDNDLYSEEVNLSKRAEEEDTEKESGRIERKSFRRKIGLLLRGSAAELPAVINRSLQPIRRSLSFSKDLNRLQEPSKPHRASSAHWYNSLVSLAEDECLDEYDDSPSENSPTIEERLFSSKVHVTRTQSLIDTTFVRIIRKRKNLSIESTYFIHCVSVNWSSLQPN